MPNAFNFSASPFDCLSTDEQALVRSNVDIAYFQPQAVVLEVGAENHPPVRHHQRLRHANGG